MSDRSRIFVALSGLTLFVPSVALAQSVEASASTSAAPTATATGAAAPAPAAAAPAPEMESTWEPWNTGGDEASYGLAVFGHIGVGHRFNNSPIGDINPDTNVISDNGFLIGIDGIVRINRYFGVGVGYEHADLGQDRLDEPPSSFSEIERDLNTLWIQARVYPLRFDPFALYVNFAGGPTWQSLDTSRLGLDEFGNPTSEGSCSGSASAGLGLRGAVGAELALVSGLVFFGELGPDGYLLTEDALTDGDDNPCSAGAGGAVNIGFRAGFAFGMEKTKKRVEVLDTDQDGIPDTADACPKEKGVPSSDPAKNGCPLRDKDKDTILDEVDACPDVPGVADPDPAKNGCPLPGDTDGDGIIDPQDACVNEKGVPSEDPKANGCPDKDGDGIPDIIDACPDLAGVKTSDPKTNGCPGDTDGDGIRDDQDACPTEPGKADPDPTRNGCPQVFVRGEEIVITEQVQFDTGTAKIKPVSDPLLDNVAKAMKVHPEILEVEVQGHTDTKGSKALNTTLSNNRANAVMKALEKRGIDKNRMTAKGYGPDVPIASNDTDEGRAKNRRVQFKITDKAKKDATAPSTTTTTPAPGGAAPPAPAPAPTPAPAPAPAPKP